jgi:hypothetical protein
MAKQQWKSSPKQMSDSWIVIDDQEDSDFVLIDKESDKQASPQGKRPLGQQTNVNTMATSVNVSQGKTSTKKRKWKVLYSLPSTGIQGNVNAANLDSYVMDQHAQLYDKQDLFNCQQRFVKVK